MTYKGYTLSRMKDLIIYDPIEGEFTSSISGKKMVDRYYSHRDRETGKVTQFSLARVAMWMMTGTLMNDRDRVSYRDGDVYNLKYSNLFVVPYEDVYKKSNNPKNSYLETEEDYIFVGTLSRLFVVRRGETQGVYRTYSKQEAIAVRDRWLASNKKLYELDDFVPKWYKNWVDENKSEENVDIFVVTP